MKRQIVSCDQCAKEINGQGVIRVEAGAHRQAVDAPELPPPDLWRGEVCSPGCLAAWFQHRIIKPIEQSAA